MRKAFGYLIAVSALMLPLATQDVIAQPRSSATSGRSAPALPPSGQQTEAIDLNEGKSAAELFQSGCAVCHQSPAGLAKGRHPNELIGFLRQHYTVSVQHAGTLAGFLTSAGPGRRPPATATPGAAPNRVPTAIRRPPADEDDAQPPSLFRRKPPEPARPQEAARPESPRAPEREAPAKRKPVERHERPAAAAAPASPPAPAAAPAAASPDTEAATPPHEPAPAAAPAAPPVEEKPAGPEIPL
ncbi:hypothetical protein [Pseudorhodoplanes sinuspersici]|uniref:Cytochrome c domain-containing protein n=1 Tax=Pseudorhodoplanes sinuspersici TaxID=1235591 RepID=A0A1W6ZY00_9HYPH|nr:hypothetical protein [Pseudorhodoplanes sinuspersici]ARQ02148.1 hypothetical protein CAK95_25890 [Pseudorhodoplanes sinuspersici]